MDQPFDDTTKTFYQKYFTERAIWAIAQYEIFARSRAIDLVVECLAADLDKLQSTVFAHFRRLNVLEFKGHHDPLTTVDFNVIMMRAWGVGAITKAGLAKRKRSTKAVPRLTVPEIAEMPLQRTVTIICVAKPLKILETL